MTNHLEPAEFQTVCTIVVLYDNDSSRARALSACDYLVSQFWQDVELKFNWWRIDFLRDPSLAQIAGDDAAVADFLLASFCDELGAVETLEAWCESWVQRRSGDRGAFVELRSVDASAEPSLLRNLFCEVCQRGGFDYLTSVANPRRVIGNGAVAGDEVLREARPPSHHGLNE